MVKDKQHIEKYWEILTLDQMDETQWEALCDRCGRCCLHKLRDEDTNEIAYTNVACRLLDAQTGQCSDYCRRKMRIPDCIHLTQEMIVEIDWLPPTCAYRLISEGKNLPEWHYLQSGSFDTVHQAGISVKGRVINERDAGDLEDYIVEWPPQES
ncbi:YcgN family cysteine cluster protein [Commensalibacter nepenthis]|uniref:UPF0260 protein QJV33_06310 n=1 Tax=Commensalibacter nepenthis TaxID=3043872 RepID=A0ABT6Q7N1_9PROT|nr:YcgN family cysteine cluster protein [Commensalibacter sp. TBRC 10068]MDI2112900.1 YcgN family cysteine cluster protein [Commensalibacter sp. TBRC 10068]